MAHVHHHIETAQDGREIIVEHALPSEFVVIRRVIYYLLDIVELFIATRFLLKVLGANSATGFVRFIYGFTGPLVAPFRGIFTPINTGTGIFEWSSLIAIIVYEIIAYGLVRLLRLLVR